MTKLAPSLFAANPLYLKEAIDDISRFGDILHLDIMDGHFVPNIALGIDVCAVACKNSTVPCFAHLMVKNPDFYIKIFGNMGTKAFVWHIETNVDHMKMINETKEMGMTPGLAISPDTPVQKLEPYKNELGLITLMSIYPGFSGQSFMPGSIPRISAIRDFFDGDIEVDGGVSLENAKSLVDASATILVSGSSFFKSNDKQGFANTIRSLSRSNK
jgi:ribulose-phosphate 3-epimerase